MFPATKRAIALARSGVANRQAAAQAGVSYSTLKRALRAAGVPAKPPIPGTVVAAGRTVGVQGPETKPAPRRSEPVLLGLEILEMNPGMAISKAARIAGCSRNALSSALRD